MQDDTDDWNLESAPTMRLNYVGLMKDTQLVTWKVPVKFVDTMINFHVY